MEMSILENQLSWTAANGRAITIKVRPAATAPFVDFEVWVQGKHVSSPHRIGPIPQGSEAKAKSLNVVGFLGPVAVNAERWAQLQAMRDAVVAENPQAHAPQAPQVVRIAAPDVLIRLEAAVAQAAAWILRHDDNPGLAYAAKRKADAALDAWKIAHAPEWEAVHAQRNAWADAENARKEAEYQQSFLARGLD